MSRSPKHQVAEGERRRREASARLDLPEASGARYRLRSFEARMALAAVLALITLGPLRIPFEAMPLIPFLSAAFLFTMPGALLAHRLVGEYFPGVALIPAAIMLNVGIFALLAVPALVLSLSLGAYMWAAGALVITSLGWAVFQALLWRQMAADETRSTRVSGWLWAPFVASGAALAAVSGLRVPRPYDDIWVYLAWVREFSNADRLAVHEPYFGDLVGEVSRARINGWLLEQAALARASGLDPVDMALVYLNPALVIVALLAFYALARVLFRSEGAALVAGCLYAMFFLAHLDASLSSFGGELVARAAEDKFVARFVFLPVALSLAVAYLESRRLGYLLAFGFACWTVVFVHPVGLAVIGLSMAGFWLVYVAVNWRERTAWTGMAALGAATLSVLIAPALYVLATGESPTSLLKDADINATDPDVLANMAFVRPEWGHILALGGDLYVMHPALILDPMILVGILAGVPFLLLRLERGPAPPLLTGTLLLMVVVCYVPQVSTFMGDNVVVPGQIWRLAWPIPLAALLTLSWMAWEALERAREALTNRGVPQSLVRLLPVTMVTGLLVATAPLSVTGAAKVYGTRELPGYRAFCFDPAFGWIKSNIMEPSVVLAPDVENTCIPAHSGSLDVVSLRGKPVLDRLSELRQVSGAEIKVPQGAKDVRAFFSGPNLEEGIPILRRHEVDYVLIRKTFPPGGKLIPPFGGRLEGVPGFTAVDVPGERYVLYKVNREKLPG